MSQLTPHLERIAALADPVADPAMVDALPTADGGTLRRLIPLLLDRGRPAGLVGLVRQFHHFDESHRRMLIRAMDRLGKGLQDAAELDDVQARLNMIAIIDAAAATRLSYLLARQLHSGDSRLTRAAAAGLLHLARRFGTRRTPESKAERDDVQAAVVEACACFHQHRRRGVLLAAMYFAHQPSNLLLRHIADRRGAAYQPAAELVAQADHPATVRALLALGAFEPLREPVSRGLATPACGAHLPLMVESAHLLSCPAVRVTLGKVKRADHLRPTVYGLGRFTAAQTRRLPRWLAALPIDEAGRLAELAKLVGSDEPIARLLALRELLGIDQAGADDVIAAMCFDAREPIARIALRHLIRRRWSGLGRLMVRLVGSPHAGLRRLAERQLGPVGFDRYWSNWPGLSPSMRATAGRALMKIDPGFLRKLAERMASDAADQRLQAVMMCRALDQASYFEPHLVRLSRDADKRVASAAVKALGEIAESQPAAEALGAALNHEDDRVRANAIEALEQMKRTAAVRDRLEHIAGGRGNRSRATAIKALLELPLADAMPQLQRMLTDGDPTHRISALWVVERLGLLPLVQEVAELARHDVQPKVRRRALRLVRDIAAGQLNHKRTAS